MEIRRGREMGIDSMFFDSADRNLSRFPIRSKRFDRPVVRMIDACQQSQQCLSVCVKC